VPEEVSFAHVIVGDVRDVDVEQTIVIEIAPVDVHALLRIEPNRRLGDVGESSVAVVVEEPVGPEIAGDIQIVEAIVVRIGMAQIESPAAGLQADLLGDIGKRTVSVVVINRYAAAIIGSLKLSGKNLGESGLKMLIG